MTLPGIRLALHSARALDEGQAKPDNGDHTDSGISSRSDAGTLAPYPEHRALTNLQPRQSHRQTGHATKVSNTMYLIGHAGHPVDQSVGAANS